MYLAKLVSISFKKGSSEATYLVPKNNISNFSLLRRSFCFYSNNKTLNK